jgi:hypothetical protein
MTRPLIFYRKEAALAVEDYGRGKEKEQHDIRGCTFMSFFDNDRI